MKVSITSLFFLCLVISFGQSRDEVRINRYSSESGLLTNSVSSVIQDESGYIWCATADGLDRFDGFQFRHFPFTSNKLISDDNAIRAMALQLSPEDSSQDLWLGTISGIIRFNLETYNYNVFHNHDVSPPDSGNFVINCIYRDPLNRIWFGTDNDLIIFLPGDKSLRRVEFNPQETENEIVDVNAVNIDDKNYLWISTRNNGLFRLKMDTSSSAIPWKLGSAEKIELEDVGLINTIYNDAWGNIWLGTQYNGAFVFDRNRVQGKVKFSTLIEYSNSKNLPDMVDVRYIEGDSSAIWLATFGDGLIKISINQTYFDEPLSNRDDLLPFRGYAFWRRKADRNRGITSNYMHHLYLDRQNILWASTDEGLNKVISEKNPFYVLNPDLSRDQNISGYRIRSILVDRKNRLWLGSIYSGLNRIDLETYRVKHYYHKSGDLSSIPSNTISSMTEDDSGNLYFGTWGAGYSILRSGRTERFSNVQIDAARKANSLENIIQAIYLDSRSNLWFGTENGLFLKSAGNEKQSHFYHDPDKLFSLSHNSIQSNAVYEDPYGNLWLGTYGGGLNVIPIDSASASEPEQVRFYHLIRDSLHKNILSSNFIISIDGYEKNNQLHLWLGTFNGGLNHLIIPVNQLVNMDRFPPDIKYELYNTSDGLSNNTIFGILSQGRYLWLSTDFGLSRLETGSGVFRNFKIEDGLPSNNFYWGASFKSKDNRLFFGTHNGLVFFNPNDIVENTFTPRVKITGVRFPGRGYINDGVLRKQNIFEVKLEENSFEIEFSGFDYNNPKTNRFRYRMDGFEDAWHLLTGINRVTYSNLLPGEYRFLLEGSNSSGKWFQQENYLTIHVVPPLWKKTWFRLFLLIFSMISVVTLFYYRNLRTEREKNALERMNRQLVRQYRERQKAEKSVTESERRYRYLIENSTDGIYLYFQDNFLIVNSAFSRLTGYTVEDLNNNNSDLLSFVAPEDIESVRSFQKKLDIQSKSNVNFEFAAINKEGDRFFVEVVLSVFPYLGGFAEQAILRDVTERKNLEEQLRQSQKMEAIGRLSGGIAHDFNNILTVIRGVTEIAKYSIDDDSELNKLLAEIEKAVDQAESLTKQLLSFGRKQLIESEIVNLNDEMEDWEQMLNRILEENIQLTMIRGEDLVDINVDKNRLTQALLNLCINAKDAMPDGGELTIITKNVFVDRDLIKDKKDISPGLFAVLIVQDTGVGIDQDTQKYIFEPFFTTKPKGKGTGLGLSMVYGIVNQSGGFVSVKSKIDRGSTFEMFFPKTNIEKLSSEQISSEEIEFLGEGKTILVVEDEDAVANIIDNTLSSSGFNVLRANNGVEALEIFIENSSEIRLVITDVIMPQMDGATLGNRLKEIAPEIDVLYISGYTDNPLLQDQIINKRVNFIQKPFRTHHLLKKVRDILKGPMIT